MFKKILIANRGEIAVRIAKACRELGITSAVLYSDADMNSLHVRVADEAYLIGPAPASESYLNISKITKLAEEIKADAIHPGYGFLSENSKFIRAVRDAGISFIGPSVESVELMGEKTAARQLMSKNNVPIVPGTIEAIVEIDKAKSIAAEIGYPIMLKASAGGGGKGMRKVNSPEEFAPAFERAQNESIKAFGSADVYMEKFIENPKHIEVQIFGDTFGNYIHLFERECSVQRRHQKVIEEAPSISVDETTREKITISAIDAAKACGYFNAGTIEFLMDEKKNFYFLEMNTRLQVEHPVTELITGIDIVKEQINIAAGEKLSVSQHEISKRGHAIECRVYAEDVDNNFAPSTGKILHHRLPSGPGIRVDRGIDLLTEVPVYYDPLLSKVTAYGKDRDEAISRLKIALGAYQIAGVVTNISFLDWVINNSKFIDGSFNINFIESEFMPLVPNKWRENYNEKYEDAAAILAALLKQNDMNRNTGKIKSNYTNQWTSQIHE